ncbi:MAG: DsbA family protein [Armatimonadetes bacterium]|nr:DsbA family protein [Armatimonadota bacterium]
MLHEGNGKHPHVFDLLLALFMLSTILLFIGTIRNITVNRNGFDDTSPPIPLTVSPTEAIGANPSFLGNPSAQYTLVEFADYQCAPCKQTNTDISKFLAQHVGTVRMVFRNLPLTDIHHSAMDAAVTAEVARQKGRFWEMHDAIYERQQTLSSQSLRVLSKERNLNLDMPLTKMARNHVENDIKYAKHLNIASVPTFILCCPNGQVFQLGALNQASAYLKP